jgi:hypothetical protein
MSKCAIHAVRYPHFLRGFAKNLPCRGLGKSGPWALVRISVCTQAYRSVEGVIPKYDPESVTQSAVCAGDINVSEVESKKCLPKESTTANLQRQKELEISPTNANESE